MAGKAECAISGIGVKRKLYLAICCGIVIAVLMTLPASVTRRINSVFGNVFSPFTSFLSGAPSFILTRLQDRSKLIEQNTYLALELEQVRYELSRLKLMEEENRKLRDLLGLARLSAHQLVAGRVIGRNINGWWQKIRLDKGSDEGVEMDMPVIGDKGLVGRTASVFANTSDVLLMVDPSCGISARLSRLDTFGIVRGYGVSLRGDALCRMDFVSKGTQIKPGDEVVTSGLGGVYPPGLVIGYVKHAYMEPSGLYQYADILPATDFRSLDVVFVVLSRHQD